MTEALPLRLATMDDLGAVVDLWNEASKWLAAKGQTQWQYPVRVDAITERIQAQRLWIMFDDFGPAATVTVDENADPNIWLPSDRPEAALYVHRLVVARRCAGRQFGARILNWAAQHAREAGREYLRLDAWTTNEGLHRYYISQGFRLVRIVEAQPKEVVSGVAFERSVM